MAMPTPSDLFAGPIFQKEMRVAGRRKGTYWTRGLFALGLIGLVGLVLLAMIDEYMRDNAVEQMQRLQMIAPALAMAMVWFQFVAVQFIAAAVTGGAICDERRARSLAVLATTPLRPSQIILGKLLSRLAQVFIVSLITLPLLLALRAFGGVEASFIFAAAALTLAAGLMSASLALWSSCTAKRATNATSFAVLIMVLYNLFPLAGMLGEYWATGRAPSMGWMRYSPGFALFLSSAGPIPAGFLPPATWQYTTLITLGLSALICLGAMRRLAVLIRRESAGEQAAAAPALPVLVAAEPGSGASETAATVLAPAGRLSRTVGDNPVLWRELRQPVARSPIKMALAITAIIVIAFITYANVGLNEPGTTAVFAVIAGIVVLSQAATASAGSITGEIEARTWPTLITTTLTPAEIVLAKIAGALRQLWILPALLLGHCVLAILAGGNHVSIIPLLVLIYSGPVVFLATTGVYFSLRLKKTATAGILNFLLGAGLWAALPMFWGIIFLGILGFHERNSFPAQIMSLIIGGNPIYLAGCAGAEAGGRPPYSFEFPTGRVSLSGFFLICFLHCTLYLAAAFGVLLLTIARFPAWSARRI